MDPALEAGLASLRDIRLPEAPGFFPPAPGWWVLAALGIVAVAAGVALGRRWRRRPRRLALGELVAIERRYQASRDAVELACDLSTLLRRAALARFEAERVAALHGEAWLEFLDAGASASPAARRAAVEIHRVALAGRCAEAGPTQEWIAFARGWIEARA